MGAQYYFVGEVVRKTVERERLETPRQLALRRIDETTAAQTAIVQDIEHLTEDVEAQIEVHESAVVILEKATNKLERVQAAKHVAASKLRKQQLVVEAWKAQLRRISDAFDIGL